MTIKPLLDIIALYQATDNPIDINYLSNKFYRHYDINHSELIDTLERLENLEIILIERVHRAYGRIIISDKMKRFYKLN